MDVKDIDLLVRNARLVTMDEQRRIFDPGAVAVHHGHVEAVGSDENLSARFHAARVIDAEGGIVHPGFVDAHNHVVHTSARGVFSDMHDPGGHPVNFAHWKSTASAADEALAVKGAALEMLRGGFTMFIEPGSLFDTGAGAAAVDEIGMRALFSPLYLWDREETFKAIPALAAPALMARAPVDSDRCLRVLDQELHRNREGSSRVRGYVFVYGEGTASQTLLRRAHEVAREHDVPLHLHVGYVPGTDEIYRDMVGRSQVEHLAELGILGPDTVLVHANGLAPGDEALIVDSKAQLVWCPAAFFSLGIAAKCRFEMMNRYRNGVPIALGTDGALDATPGDIRRAARFQSQAYADPVAPGELLEMQTIHGAAVAGCSATHGSLAPGRKADLVVQAAHGAGANPSNNPAHILSLGLGGNSARTVIIDGEIVLEYGHSTRVDEAALYRELARSVERRATSVGIQIAPEWGRTRTRGE